MGKFLGRGGQLFALPAGAEEHNFLSSKEAAAPESSCCCWQTCSSSALQLLLPALQRRRLLLQLLLLLQQVGLSSGSRGLKQRQEALTAPAAPSELLHPHHGRLTCGLGSVDGCSTAGWYAELEAAGLCAAKASWDDPREDGRLEESGRRCRRGWDKRGAYGLEGVVLVHRFYAGVGRLGDRGVLKGRRASQTGAGGSSEIHQSAARRLEAFLCPGSTRAPAPASSWEPPPHPGTVACSSSP